MRRFFEFLVDNYYILILLIGVFAFVADQFDLGSSIATNHKHGPQILVKGSFEPLCSRFPFWNNINDDPSKYEFKFKLSDRTCDYTEPFLSLPDDQKRSINFDAEIHCSVAKENKTHEIANAVTYQKRLPPHQGTLWDCNVLNRTHIDPMYDIKPTKINCKDSDLRTCRFVSKLVFSSYYVFSVSLCIVMCLVSFRIADVMIDDGFCALKYQTRCVLSIIAFVFEFLTLSACLIGLFGPLGSIAIPLLTPIFIFCVFHYFHCQIPRPQ